MQPPAVCSNFLQRCIIFQSPTGHSYLGLATVSKTTFHRHLSLYLEPTVMTLWSRKQQALIDTVLEQSGPVILGGDMRADSPGHCAKYGSYTMMDLVHNRIIDIQLIQVLYLKLLNITD